MALSKLILFVLLVAQTCVAVAQGRPDQLPQDFTPTGTDEVYMQNRNEGSANPVPRRMDFATMRGYFGAQVVTLATVPAPTGNAQRNVVGQAPNGQVYFIDHEGRSLRLGGAGAYVEQLVPNHTGATVTLTAPVADASKVRVWRSGRELRWAFGDFTIAGNQLTFALPCTGNNLIIQTPL